MEGCKVWLLGTESIHEPRTLINANTLKERMGNHKRTNVEMVSIKLELPWGFLGGKEKGSL